MFISSSYLSFNYGVDEKIAAFFVDRDPPSDNLYWAGKLLYLRPAPGYLFIPLIVDLLFKLGIEQNQLLSGKFVQVLEQVGHIIALEESGLITGEDAIENCTAIVKDCINEKWLHQLLQFLNNRNDNVFRSLAHDLKALHRGDLFLFTIATLQFSDELFSSIAENWFALIGILLLLDDAEDIEIDKQSGDQNAFLESGLNAAGLETIMLFVRNSLRKISTLNTVMAYQLDNQFKQLVKQPHIDKYLNNATWH